MDYFDKSYQAEGYKTNDDIKSWEKCYWYLRLLVDTNRYGALAKDSKRLTILYNELISTYRLIQKEDNTESEKNEILLNILEENLFEKIKKDSKKEVAFGELIVQLKQLLLEPKDFLIFALTIKELLLPANDAIANVPTTESTDFARKYGKAVLDAKKEKGLASLIRDWDNFTEALSLNKERDLIVGLFKTIRENLASELSTFSELLNSNEIDIILSAICQEYERRVGQKRKQRAGNDLESVTEFVFNYFGIKTAGSPDHFTTGLEVDNWVKDKNGWYIGISLKRTLRERWKQTYTTEIGLLDRHKIKYIIHILNNDLDLSDSKITELGSYRHLFFMADSSSTLNKLKDHVAMGKYVFPMSSLIDKIKEFMK
jgi:hypothetical protein